MNRFVVWRPNSREVLFVVGVALALAMIAVAALRSGVDFSGSDGRSPQRLPARGASVVSVEFPSFDESFAILSTPAAATGAAAVTPVESVPPGAVDGDGEGTGGGTDGDDGLTGVEPVDETVDAVVDVLPVDPTGTVEIPDVDEDLDGTADTVVDQVVEGVGDVTGLTGQD